MRKDPEGGFTLVEMLVVLFIISLTSLGLISLTRLYARSITRVQTDVMVLSSRQSVEPAFAEFSSQIRSIAPEEAFVCERLRVSGMCIAPDASDGPCTMTLTKAGGVWRLEANTLGSDVSIIMPFPARMQPSFSCRPKTRGVTLILELKDGAVAQPWLVASIEGGG